MSFFSEAEVDELVQGRQAVQGMAKELQRDLLKRSYRCAESQEHATHGLARRLGVITQCIEHVFDVLPPDQVAVPERQVLMDPTINIQALVFNVFGCYDNIAWVWALENDLRGKDGKPLGKKRIGLGPKFQEFRESCPQTFRDYLVSRDSWFDNLIAFRDALAHRIPLYIPPYTVATHQVDEYQRLEAEKDQALAVGDIAAHDAIEARQGRFERFTPIMSHSLFEAGSKKVVFHAQLIADFRTVDEMGRRMLAELDVLRRLQGVS